MLASSLVAQEDVTPTPGLATSPAASIDCTLGLELPSIQSLGKACVEKQNQRGLSEGYTVPLFFLETPTFIYPWIKRDHPKKKEFLADPSWKKFACWPPLHDAVIHSLTKPLVLRPQSSPVRCMRYLLQVRACKRGSSPDFTPGSLL